MKIIKNNDTVHILRGIHHVPGGLRARTVCGIKIGQPFDHSNGSKKCEKCFQPKEIDK